MTAARGSTAVPMLQALSWGAESPLRPSGEVDIEALAHGLARSDYPGGRRRQPDAPVAKRLHPLNQVLERAPQAVEAPDDERVRWP